MSTLKRTSKDTDDESIRNAMNQRAELMASLEDRTKTGVDLSKLLHGPLEEMSVFEWQIEMFKSFQHGENMILTERLARKYNEANHDSPGINLVWPMMITPQGKMPYRACFFCFVCFFETFPSRETPPLSRHSARKKETNVPQSIGS